MKNLIAVRSAKIAFALLLSLALDSTCQAGPFADWWLNNTRSGYTNNGPVIPLTPTTSGYGTYPYNAYTGYPNTSYSPVLPAGLPQTVPGLLPTGGYASQYYRAPTTYYRPVTSLDPNTGTTVTSLQPCASYQYQAQRVPLLVPSWSNYAYGGYGASSLQNRWSPITAPAVGSAAGQSSLSIASGFGTYGTSPVVQLPATGAALSTAPALPTAQPITSGYGGIYYGQSLAASNIVGNSNVVPAAAWAAPIAPQYNSSVPAYSSTPLNGSSYSSSYGGYFGSVPQAFTQPATVSPPISTTTSGYAPSGPATTVNGVTITPIGPPVTSSYPTNSINGGTTSSSLMPSQPYPSMPATVPSQPQTSILPNSTSGFGSMPGSMGQSIMPSAVSPFAETPSTSVFPPVMPSTPAPPSVWSPSPNASIPSALSPSALSPSALSPSALSPSALSPSALSYQDVESTVAPSLQPSIAENRKPEAGAVEAQPRFQLRSVERQPLDSSTLNETPKSPWTNQNSDVNTPASNVDPSKDSSNEPELQLNMDSLRPIPAPQNFDATPDWKPALLNARDQTAADSRIRTIDRQSSNASSFREVRFLNSVRQVEPAPMGKGDSGIQATLRPISKPHSSADVKALPSDVQSLNTSGWSTVSGR